MRASVPLSALVVPLAAVLALRAQARDEPAPAPVIQAAAAAGLGAADAITLARPRVPGGTPFEVRLEQDESPVYKVVFLGGGALTQVEIGAADGEAGPMASKPVSDEAQARQAPLLALAGTTSRDLAGAIELAMADRQVVEAGAIAVFARLELVEERAVVSLRLLEGDRLRRGVVDLLSGEVELEPRPVVEPPPMEIPEGPALRSTITTRVLPPEGEAEATAADAPQGRISTRVLPAEEESADPPRTTATATTRVLPPEEPPAAAEATGDGRGRENAGATAEPPGDAAGTSAARGADQPAGDRAPSPARGTALTRFAPEDPALLLAEPRFVGFDGLAPGSLPSGWLTESTRAGQASVRFEIIRDASAPSGTRVLGMPSERRETAAPTLCYGRMLRMGAGTLELRLRTGGTAGLAWRIRDRATFVVLRVDRESQRLVLEHWDGLEVRELASAPAALNAIEWVALRVEDTGTGMRGGIVGGPVVEADLGAAAPTGAVGIWAGPAGTSRFDDLRLVPRSGAR